jgi:hypothetical protein
MTDELAEWEKERFEYEMASEYWRHFSSLRRQELSFVILVQGGVLTIIGEKLLHLTPAHSFLSIIAFLVILLGLNSERRLSAYQGGNYHRMQEIEATCGMRLWTVAVNDVRGRKLSFNNAKTLPVFYIILAVGWVFIWICNLFSC